ncbi:uncharacterized protein G2W53_043771 [Senna tora]|uniref:Uncharacterized protein n=1 Tax=Senna tora TaxID=362788 RepID=A0A834SLS6_9FABA|nr:uncharacterized protein G2W53_043771 [Senna tora]
MAGAVGFHGVYVVARHAELTI